jgi:two-component sensor histidine kinase
LIHEKLYRSDNLAQIQFDEYIRDLSAFLLHTYSDNIHRIRLDVQAEPVSLDLDTAIPCSLIINELVSNSLKHGFPPDYPALLAGNGQISVKLAKQSTDRIQLIVEDNGVGFPPDIDFRKTKSLGLQLINSLTRQIGGDICFSNPLGGRVEIDFSLDG